MRPSGGDWYPLKPDATSMLSVSCVAVVVAQPTATANTAITLIMFGMRLSVSFIWYLLSLRCLRDDFIGRRQFAQQLWQTSWGSVDRTFIQCVRLTERTAEAQFGVVVKKLRRRTLRKPVRTRATFVVAAWEAANQGQESRARVGP